MQERYALRREHDGIGQLVHFYQVLLTCIWVRNFKPVKKSIIIMARNISDGLKRFGGPWGLRIVYKFIIDLRIGRRGDDAKFYAFGHGLIAAYEAFFLQVAPAAFKAVAHIVAKNRDLV